MDIAIRELKSSLSRVLAAAQGGEVIEVTSHRKPVALPAAGASVSQMVLEDRG